MAAAGRSTTSGRSHEVALRAAPLRPYVTLSERQNQAAPHAARGEEPVRLDGLLRRKRPGHPGGDLTVLRLLPQPVELGALPGVAEHDDRLVHDASFTGTVVAAQR